MGKSQNYWVNKDKDINSKSFRCPNVSLFRFVSSLFVSVENKKILEIGFKNGDDLLEFNKRGALIFGLDINPEAVSFLKFEDKSRIRTSRSGKDPIPFNILFDLIYSRDTIYYLSDKEIQFFFNDAKNKIKKDGYIIVHFIERDLFVQKSNPEEEINFNLFTNAISDSISDEYNPIRFLSSRKIINAAKGANFELIASKRLIQSYDIREEKFRIERYFAFKSNDDPID